MKDSSIVKILKRLFGIKNTRNDMSVEEILKLDYYECISYFYNGKEKPIVMGFKDNVIIWLITSIGDIELDEIPHSNGHLTNNVYEIESLISENNFDYNYLLQLINEALDEKWN